MKPLLKRFSRAWILCSATSNSNSAGGLIVYCALLQAERWLRLRHEKKELRNCVSSKVMGYRKNYMLPPELQTIESSSRLRSPTNYLALQRLPESEDLTGRSVWFRAGMPGQVSRSVPQSYE